MSNSRNDTQWPKPAVSVLVLRENTVLFGQRANAPYRGMWSLPGGRIEAGETVADAGLRELLEETGVRAEIIEHVGVRDIIDIDDAGTVRLHYVLSVLTAQWVSGEGVAASDCLATAWVRKDELDAYTLTDGTAELIRSVFDRRP